MNSPFAGDEMVELSVIEVSATLGGRNPLLLTVTSNWADALGEEVFIQTCEKAKFKAFVSSLQESGKKKNAKKKDLSELTKIYNKIKS